MRIFGPLYDRVIRWSRHPHAPWYLGGLSVAESSFFPIPPDVMLIPMAVARPPRAISLAALTTICSVVGGLIGYLIGYFAFESVRPVIEAAGYSEHLLRAELWYAQWGVWVVLLAGFSPIPYKIFTIASGALALALAPFVLASIVGRGARFFLVAWLAGRFGPVVEQKLRQHMEIAGWFTVVLFVVVYLMVRG